MKKDYQSIEHELAKGIKESDKIKVPFGRTVFVMELCAAIWSILLSLGDYYEEISVFGLRLEPDFLDMFEDGWFFLALYIFSGFSVLIGLGVTVFAIIVAAINCSLKLKAETLNNAYRTAIMTEEMLNILKSKYPEHTEKEEATPEANTKAAVIQKNEKYAVPMRPHTTNFTTCPYCDTKQQGDRKFCMNCGFELL